MELLGRGRLVSPGVEGLKVKWFTSWHPLLDEALAVLPEMETCPHELSAALMRNPSPTAKRMALVMEGHCLACMGRMPAESHPALRAPSLVRSGATPPLPAALVVARLAPDGVVEFQWGRTRRSKAGEPRGTMTNELLDELEPYVGRFPENYTLEIGGDRRWDSTVGTWHDREPATND